MSSNQVDATELTSATLETTAPPDPWDAQAKLNAWRKAVRLELLQARGALSPELHRRKSEQVLDRLAATCMPVSGSIVGFYWPLRGEIDVMPFIDLVLAAGGVAALPVVVAKAQPLEFRAWKPGDPMARGGYDIPYPVQGVCMEPDLLIVPLVGFDRGCYRLGYGGGYYDRTLWAARKKPRTVGVGFETAKIETIHPQAYDVPLDCILTEAATMERWSA